MVPDLTGFVAKKEMRFWPLIGWWMSSVYCLFLDRKDRKQGITTILEGVKYVKKGISMWIFPEGTRSKTEGEMLPFKHGSFKLATKSEAPIVPVALNGSGKIFDDHPPIIKKGKVRVEFLTPIETKGLSPEELNNLPDRVHAMIVEKVKAHADYKNLPIGVFDSGVGGLTVVKRLTNLPNEKSSISATLPVFPMAINHGHDYPLLETDCGISGVALSNNCNRL